MAKTIDRHKRFTAGLTPERGHLAKGEIGDLRRDVEEAFKRLATDVDFDMLSRFKMSRLLGSLKEVNSKVQKLMMRNRVSEALWSGTSTMKLAKSAFDVTAADLNAAAAGTFKRKFTFSVVTPKTEKIYFLTGLVPVLTPAKTVADVDVAVPAITGTPSLKDGTVTVEITFDTDAGVTKTYAAGDEVSMACDLAVAGVALQQVTVTWTVA